MAKVGVFYGKAQHADIEGGPSPQRTYQALCRRYFVPSQRFLRLLMNGKRRHPHLWACYEYVGAGIWVFRRERR